MLARNASPHGGAVCGRVLSTRGPGVKDGADYGQCRLRRECRPSAAYAAAAPLLTQSDAYQMRRQPQQLIVTDCSRRARDRTGATGWGGCD